jgi:hypothetical protein
LRRPRTYRWMLDLLNVRPLILALLSWLISLQILLRGMYMRRGERLWLLDLLNVRLVILILLGWFWLGITEDFEDRFT